MQERATGPPALRPHVRPRRLEMSKVWASEQRREQLKAAQEQRLQADYVAIEEAQMKQKRGDEALELFGDLLAALLCSEWPEAEPMSEPVQHAGELQREIRCDTT